MPHIGWQELMIVIGVALLIFGPKRLPEVGRSLGSAVKEFRAGTLDKGLKESADIKEAVVEPEGAAAGER